jgi:UTP-glucose-1-phosphate uridylyltransferase/mevalonate kinase
MRLFVPGRICLFGEHSDWAGGYRRINAEIEKGYTIITGINQGIYADVKPHPSKFIYHASIDEGKQRESIELPMDAEVLLETAQKGGFFSYAAGVAYQVLTHYRVRGLEIDNYCTDMPIKKGLSSSAAVCVLVARAFNRIYDLKLTIRGEMEIAYLGEITTPSRCGRMDQGCAYGDRPILMVFDGDRIEVKEISSSQDLYLIITDLNAGKDTREILNSLNHCYPFAENDIQKKVQKYLGPINARIVDEAAKAIKAGNPQRIGDLMKEAQEQFNKHLQPACPSQLTAPILHKVLNHSPLKPFVYGGKGVGSQGDGSVQFIAKDKDAQEKAMEILNRDFSLSSLKLILRSGYRVRKAVVPAAGYGTRLFPASKAVKKELFPVIDHKGRAKPVILAIVEEALSAGIEEVGIIVQAKDRELFEEIFCTPPPIESFNKLSRENQKYSEYLMEIGNKIVFLSQDIQEGFGHAVYCAKEWVGDEPFLLLLGDHLYASQGEFSCAQQMLDVYERVGRNVVGLKTTSAAEIQSFGCVAGVWKEKNKLLDVVEFKEKPDIDYARRHLRIDGMGEEVFLTIFGQYILSPKIFDFLEENIRLNIREMGEFQLTSCLDRLRQEDGFVGYIVDGQRFDIGTPGAYCKTVNDFKNY